MVCVMLSESFDAALTVSVSVSVSLCVVRERDSDFFSAEGLCCVGKRRWASSLVIAGDLSACHGGRGAEVPRYPWLGSF